MGRPLICTGILTLWKPRIRSNAHRREQPTMYWTFYLAMNNICDKRAKRSPSSLSKLFLLGVVSTAMISPYLRQQSRSAQITPSQKAIPLVHSFVLTRGTELHSCSAVMWSTRSSRLTFSSWDVRLREVYFSDLYHMVAVPFQPVEIPQ